MRRSLVAVVLAVGLPAALSAAAQRVHAAAEGLPTFYKVPAHWHHTQALLKSQKVTVAGLNGEVWRVMYTRRPTSSSPCRHRLRHRPERHRTEGGWPVVAWDHGTNGMADPCAPSLSIGSSDISTA